MLKKQSLKMAKTIPHNPFNEYGDIGNPYHYTTVLPVVDSEYENGLKTADKNLPIQTINPYDKSIITKKATSIGRAKRTWSISNELVMRLKLLTARINQDRMQRGKKRVCSESDLIEEAIRGILKKNRYKFLPENKLID